MLVRQVLRAALLVLNVALEVPPVSVAILQNELSQKRLHNLLQYK